MIKVSLDSAVLLVVIIAVLVGVSQYGLPAITDHLQQRLVNAANQK